MVFIVTVACHSLSLAIQSLILVLSQLRLSLFISFLYLDLYVLGDDAFIS